MEFGRLLSDLAIGVNSEAFPTTSALSVTNRGTKRSPGTLMFINWYFRIGDHPTRTAPQWHAGRCARHSGHGTVHSGLGDFPAPVLLLDCLILKLHVTRCVSFAVMLRTDNECGPRLIRSLEVWP